MTVPYFIPNTHTKKQFQTDYVCNCERLNNKLLGDNRSEVSKIWSRRQI